MAEQRHSWYLPWVIQCVLIVMLSALVLDCLHVMWPYPHQALGLESFQKDIRREWDFLIKLCGPGYPETARAIYSGLHWVLFEWPGFDGMLVRAQNPAPLSGLDEMMRRAVLRTSEFWGTALSGLELFSMRLAVLAVSLPLIALTAICGFADGLLARHLRRTGGGRESAFVYHRAKRHAGHAVLALGLIYAASPVTFDSRVAITAFVVVFPLLLRIGTATFKKYL
mgnify:CR=1 FL=1